MSENEPIRRRRRHSVEETVIAPASPVTEELPEDTLMVKSELAVHHAQPEKSTQIPKQTDPRTPTPKLHSKKKCNRCLMPLLASLVIALLLAVITLMSSAVIRDNNDWFDSYSKLIAGILSTPTPTPTPMPTPTPTPMPHLLWTYDDDITWKSSFSDIVSKYGEEYEITNSGADFLWMRYTGVIVGGISGFQRFFKFDQDGHLDTVMLKRWGIFNDKEQLVEVKDYLSIVDSLTQLYGSEYKTTPSFYKHYELPYKEHGKLYYLKNYTWKIDEAMTVKAEFYNDDEYPWVVKYDSIHQTNYALPAFPTIKITYDLYPDKSQLNLPQYLDIHLPTPSPLPTPKNVIGL